MVTNKKGQSIGFLQQAGIGLGILVITIAVLVQVLGGIKNSLATPTVANTTAYNVTVQGLDSFQTFGQNFGTIALVLVLVVIIGLFAFLGKKRA